MRFFELFLYIIYYIVVKVIRHSGGPLQYFPSNESAVATVIGIVSFGIGCGSRLPSVYTRVAYYLDWIEPIVWPEL